ncbi:OmpA family protein [Thalassotalea agariperforans]
MGEKDSSSSAALDEQNLSELREILLGKNYHLVTEQIKHQSRDLVKDVVAEAIYDRNKQDKAIDNILQPIVERSVETSVNGSRDKLISSLYPLVGGLVRKSVKAFLSDFIEKTNQLLENSFTIKGLKWRFKARQAGVSFAQYVVSQTFVYRVEHILLIHRETGILLKSVDHNKFGHSDVDLISSMLTAINDFVADSLVQRDENEEQLQTIRTDNFSLLIKPGPYAMIVLAVTGNSPHRLLDQMQLTLENIHQLYDEELRNFSGDVDAFDGADNQLRHCLLSEEKAPETNNHKKPWLAWLLLTAMSLGIVYWLVCLWQSQQLTQQIRLLNQEPGFAIQSLTVDWDQRIHLDVIRDPNAMPVKQWLASQGIATNELILTEHLFYSIDPALINVRLTEFLQLYPTLDYHWQDKQLVISGQLALSDKTVFMEQLSHIVSLPPHAIDVDNIEYIYAKDSLQETNKEQQKALFFLALAEFNLLQVNFEIASSQLTDEIKTTLADISVKYQQLEQLAATLEFRLALVLVGTSDTQGTQYINDKLSLARALNVKKQLVELGLDKNGVYATNIGTVTLADVPASESIETRKVIFNIVYVDVSKPQGKK